MKVIRPLLRFWFTFEETVDRDAYLRHGLGLVALKYGVDAALVAAASGLVWTPLDYLRSVPFVVSARLGDAAPYLGSVLAVWTLPFLWIGISMTMRRLLDAGWSAWWSLLFFVPVANYVLMTLLALAPTEGPRVEDFYRVPEAGKLPTALLSMAVGGLAGVALLWVAVLELESYGLALFMGTPFVVGVVTGYVLRRRYPASAGETAEVVAMTVFLVAGSAFVVGIEGAVCLLMVAPLALVLALMGGLAGRHMAKAGEAPFRGAVLIAVLLPGAASLERGPQPAQLREVRTAVEVDAPPDVVWGEVIAFSPIPEPTSLLFRLGLAYPTHAELEGEGVGAVRTCHFSTGAFVEPITVWEPGRRLSFDVVENPRPLNELTPWRIAPPHLDGYLVSRAGEFRLVPIEGGRTRLEGSTWYEQKLRPEGYWVLFSDYIIHRIHRRVLEHIRSEAERAGE